MGATSIQDAKVLISSTKVADRNAGLKDLIHILRHPRARSSLENVGNKAYFALCETLLQCLCDERSSLLRSRSKTSKTAALLPLAATGLRLVIEAGVRTFKNATVEYIVDSILELLPGKDGGLLKPLLEDLPKALRALLEYQPHVERLPQDCWDAAVDFCIESVSAIFAEPDSELPNSWSTGVSSRALTPFESTDGVPRPSPRNPSAKHKVADELMHTADELIQCLRLLVKAPNAPVLEKADTILTTLIQFLQRKAGRSAANALAAINSILPRIVLNAFQLTERVVQDLLPLLKAFWSDSTLRDEILTTLTYAEVHIANMLATSRDDSMSFDLEALIDTIYADYRRRQETPTSFFLEEDHVCFRHIGKARDDTHPLNTYAFSMNMEHIRCEGYWVTVATIARFSALLDARKRRLAEENSHEDDVMVKRLRITNYFQDYLRNVSEPRSNAKRAALQVTAFMIQEGPRSEEELQSLLEKLTPCISDENPALSSWAMIALAAAAFQKSSQLASLQPYWKSAWSTASRVVSSSSSSRAACHLMDVLLKLAIVPFPAVSPTVQTMLSSIELNGPALLTESSSALMATLIMEKIAENPTNYDMTAERILNWLLKKWTPGSWSDRAYAALSVHHCNAHDILRVLYACLDRSFHAFQAAPFRTAGPLAHARMRVMPYRSFSQYLLLLEDEEDFRLRPAYISNSSSSAPSHHAMQLESRILDHCHSQLVSAKQRWKEVSQQNPSSIGSDMLRLLTNSCIVAAALGTLIQHHEQRLADLELVADDLAQSFVQLLAKPQTELYKVDAVLESCAQNLPNIAFMHNLSRDSFKDTGLIFLATHLSRTLEDRKEIKQSFHVEDDEMDIDEDSSTQKTQNGANPDMDVPRQDVQALTETEALHACCLAYLHLVSSVRDMVDDEQDQIPSEFIEHLTAVSESDLLRSRQFVQALTSSPFHITRADSMRLLERLSDALIDPLAREYNTSEVANSMVVDVLVSTIEIIRPDSNDREAQDLYDNVGALYAYYARDMEKAGVRRSPDLQIRIAAFLHSLLRHMPDFVQNRKTPSVRTSLFELLRNGEMSVKYHIAKRLPEIFEDFVLTEHDNILGDVDQSLPHDNQWLEGIALRLLVLSMLASRWHTLLRQCVYHIFATAGSAAAASRHAHQCICRVAEARDMGDARNLFRLFAPQIIFTWVVDRKHKFADMPYTTFGYTTRVELLRDVESEALGQAAMAGLQDEVDYVARQLGVKTSEALAQNISKSAAYTISWDTCRGSARNKSLPSHANLLRDLVGQAKYYQLVQDQFPQILGHILQTIDHEERISKQLEKRPAFNETSKALAEMNNISHSTLDLNIDIQPSFPANYLFDQLERLCRRTAEDPVSIWTPSNYALVARMLLDRIHPALGSLYARSIIRKIRIVVALAGPVACGGYPLQMTLQSLRPFLTDIQCAEDTVGIMQYLFEHGVQDLRNDLSFVTGIGLSVLISIRVFLGSSQESTTQQSQYRATMNTATRFHAWFTSYLKSYAQSLTGSERISSIKAFKLITVAASQVRTEGNSVRGSDESKLLLEILDDVRSERKLLNNTSREVALNLLCQNFQPASTARDDVLGSDFEAAEYAPYVWDSCQRNNVGDGYLLWAARVLGRAFGAHGEVKRSSAHSLPWTQQASTSKDSTGRASRETIVKEVVSIFYSDDRSEVSLAEEAIRIVISRLPHADTGYVVEMTKIIPLAIGAALGLPPPNWNSTKPQPKESLETCAAPIDTKDVSEWIKDLVVTLCHVASQDPLLGALGKLIVGINHMAERLFPYILHLVLLGEFDGERAIRDTMSAATMAWFSECDLKHVSHVRILIQAILYLRSQPTPKEVTRVDRDHWLEIEYLKASQAATTCGMYRSALLFAETSSGQPILKTTTRRSSVLVEAPKLPVGLQLAIYKNLDEPDSFYGIDRGYSLSSVIDRLDYEGDATKSLLFRGARLNGQMRRSQAIDPFDAQGAIKSFIKLNMDSVGFSLLSTDQFRRMGDEGVDYTLDLARKLSQWDVKAPELNHTEPSTLFKAFQGLYYAPDVVTAKHALDQQFLATTNFLAGKSKSSVPVKIRLRTLAVLAEADEVICAARPEHLLDVWDRMKGRERWMRAGELEDVRQLLSSRETLFSVLSTNAPLLESLHARTGTIRGMEVEALVSSSAIFRRHGALQESHASATYLIEHLIQDCRAVGLDIEATAQNEMASVLWEQHEEEASIRMRQHLIDHANFDSQETDVSLPVLLAKLGHHIAEARLAKPDVIIKEYLQPAIRELRGPAQGSDPGQVFHEFALFCDKQLQSPDAAEDMERVKTVMERKLQEYQDFVNLASTDKSKGMRETYKRNAHRAKTWYQLDRKEYDRLRAGREQFLRQCLENYLLSLQASDEFNNDALRVFALWLEYSDTTLANEAVGAHIGSVPSAKFALLMNQLSSRLQADTSEFQKLLNGLVFRICVDHPYHGMHQIFAIQTKVGNYTREDIVRSKDESARSRQKAANTIAGLLARDKNAQPFWNVIYKSNQIYHALAMFKDEKDNRQGREIPLDRYAESRELVQRIPAMNVPPATLQIEVRADRNYNDLPKISSFKSKMSIANGLSAPKVITATGTDGRPYKQLFKSGNDDLRQDAIMEQVFDQVSRLLKNHTATRLRNLGIRTYKVLPLSTRSGLMEFVQNTVPLHPWVMPAHEKYYPNDYKPDRCRKEIGACQQDSLQTRVKVWQKIADNFHPVLRYFLLERFEDPDEWFERRLAYTRSTAAISILGHVLGLGDRHCHNILLDEKSGEVVHIDLGVSFEAGRVLPVPEVVPFRLTRDLVDAMGYTKTEGVFRRCCEFTMDTLREERESIMTLLNVLRYDPLVNWSVTPTKAKRMQEGQDTNAQNGTRAGTVGPGGTPAPSATTSGLVPDPEVQESNKKREEQAGEAGRALSVVEKKLSKTLSTKATVNELIQTATDERNLAVLYMGWASYA